MKLFLYFWAKIFGMFYANELKLLKHLLRFVHTLRYVYIIIIIIIIIKQPSSYIFERKGARALPSRFRLFRHTREYNTQAIFPKSKTIFLSGGSGGVRFDKLAAARHPARSIRAAATADTVAVIDTRGNDDAVAAAAAAFKSIYFARRIEFLLVILLLLLLLHRWAAR